MSAFAQAECTEHISQEISEPPPQIGYDGELLTMPLSWIVTSPLNPRKTFQESYIVDLAVSMKEIGQLQPIVVRRRMKEHAGTPTYEYEIIMGECRFRAARIAGFSTIKAIVRHNLSDREHLEMALVENLQRKDINPIEEASGYKQLAEMGLSQKEICAKVNRSQGAVSNAMRLLKLPESVLDYISQGHLSPAHGISIVSYAEFPAIAETMAEFVIKRKIAAAELAKGADDLWQLWHDLQEKKLCVDLGYGGHSPFEKDCPNCPFGAYRKPQNSGRGRCLRPEHHAELSAAARAEAEAKIAKETEALRRRAEGNPKIAERLTKMDHAGCALPEEVKALNLDDMAQGSYSQIYDGDEVEGCSAACPCRTIALSSRNQPCRICIDPGRRNALKGQETKARKKRIKEKCEQNVALLKFAGKDVAVTQFARSLALVAWTAIRSTPADVRRAAAKSMPESELKALVACDIHSVQETQAWKILSAVDSAELLAILAELRIREETRALLDYGSKEATPLADFLLRPPKNLLPPPEMPRDIDCPDCKGLARLKRPEGAAPFYECGCGYSTELKP